MNWINNYSNQKSATTTLQPHFRRPSFVPNRKSSQAFIRDSYRVSKETNEMLLNVDELDFNCFLFHENSDGEGLTLLLPYLFHSNDLYEKLNLKKDTLYNFANKVQNGYLNNPYHNKIHGFDVCQVLKKILFFYNLCLRL